ncbi:galactose-specific lectin nattectin-like protein [Labeo rohita]|uniref:Galactose-specific lectin nattectin-like protein n=1 Tax=Labeo rohita TaxID=84645 RepID=A0A498N1K3_LABRO|nr:galactose-specific lectin nattectin-like protein [Labeo rohita]
MCLAHDGNLASVHTYEEYRFIQSLIQTKNQASTEAWIGGYDAVKEGTWLWSDGSKMNLELWAPEQPDNYEEEHCLGMNYGTSGNWNDYTCDFKMAFVCAKKLTPASVSS